MIVRQVELLKTMDRRQANHLFWSPAGKFIVLAGLRNMNGVLEFIDTSGLTSIHGCEMSFIVLDDQFTSRTIT